MAICYVIVRKRIKLFLVKYFGTSDLKEAIERSEIIDSETPKSLSSMESVYSDKIRKDFPNLNISQLKSETEALILDILNCISLKDISRLEKQSDKVKRYVESKINDLGDNFVKYDRIKFHKTVVNRYENTKGIATIYIRTSLEYFYKEGDKIGRKIQDRFEVEFIYIIDASKVSDELKVLGLNCPNCGSPVTCLGRKVCEYCGSGLEDIVERSFIVNNVKDF